MSSNEDDDFEHARQLVLNAAWDNSDQEEDLRSQQTSACDNRNEELKWAQDFARLFEPMDGPDEPDTATLKTEYNELVHALQRFEERLPPKSRTNFNQRPQTIGDVINAVKSAEQSWTSAKDESAWRTPKRYFHKFCGTLDSHSTILQVLPGQSEYISLLYGTLLSVIKASANYQKIAEGLSKSLTEINDIAAACVKDLRVFPTKDLKKGVASLYAQIFLFLSDVMEWYSKRSRSRLLQSFREDFYKEFENRIAKLKQISESIGREAAHIAQFEGRVTGFRVKHVEDTTFTLLEESRMDRAGRKGRERQLADEIASANQLLLDIRRHQEKHTLLIEEAVPFTSNLLLSQGPNRLNSPLQKVELTINGGAQERLGSSVPTNDRHEIMATLRMTKAEVQLNSRKLEDFILEGEKILPSLLSHYYAEEEIVTSVRSWTQNPKSQAICVTGPSDSYFTSPLTPFARYFVSLCESANVPIISYECGSFRPSSLDSSTTASSDLVSLVYSTIRKLVDLMPPAFEEGKDLSKERFARLDGTLASWDEAISVMDDLLDLAPAYLFCVVNGLHHLDDPSTESKLNILISTLCNRAKVQCQNTIRVFKLLLTTYGLSSALVNSFSMEDFVLVERASIATTPGLPMPGREPLVQEF